MTGPLSQEQRLAAAGAALDLRLLDSQVQTLLAYMSQMQRWNRTYNLTALRDPEKMLVQHLFDSLAVVKPIEDMMARRDDASAATIVDVGSGGGLPGVVIAVLRPDWQVHCIDAVEKKMAFVRQMSGVLHLPNLHAVHARVEALEPLEADVVVSRAFASLSDFAGLAGKHVRAGGHLLAMKGREPAEEVQALKAQALWDVDCIEPLTVPELDARRCLIWMSRHQGKL